MNFKKIVKGIFFFFLKIIFGTLKVIFSFLSIVFSLLKSHVSGDNIGKNELKEKILIFIRKRIVVNGIENVPSDGRFITIPNHISHLEPFFISGGFLNELRRINKLNRDALDMGVQWLTDKKIFNTWQRFADFLGMVIATKEGLEKEIEYLKKGISVGIFGEGRMNPTDTLLRFHIGGAILAEAGVPLGIPVLPVGYIGPASRSIIKNVFYNLPCVLCGRKVAQINIGKPMYFRKEDFGERTKEDYQRIVDRIGEEVSQLCGKGYDRTAEKKK